MNIQKFLNKETIFYTIFGVLTTVVDFAAFALLHYIFNINEIISNTIAWILAVATAYITNKLFVFESKSFSFSVIKHELPSFILARVFSLIITDIFLAFASVVNMNMLLAKVLISVFVIVANYVFSKLFVFKKKATENELIEIELEEMDISSENNNPEEISVTTSSNEINEITESNEINEITEITEITEINEETENVSDVDNDIDDITIIEMDNDDIQPKKARKTRKKLPAVFLPCLFAFIIPVVILSVVFISRGVYPFGDSIYLRSDAYHQYAPFYKELYRKLTEGESLFYSWNIGMGVNFTALYAYYLASPINLLLGIIAVKGNILVTMDVLIIIKTGICGLTFAYYLLKHFEKINYAAPAIAVFYALSSYMAAYSWNIMWIDCVAALPLIALGIEYLVKKKKWLLYTLSLGFAIFSNYYIGIMLCIFSVIYFFIMLISYEKITIYKASVRVLHFIKGSLLAGGLGAILFLPALYALSYTVSANSEFPSEWKNYFSIMDMLSRSLMNVEVSILNSDRPNIYCTVAVLIMVPLYCMCKEINHREKVCKVAVLGLILLSFNLNIPDFIWHGFHFPNSLPARHSFIYIFLILTMVYEAAIHIKTYTKKQIYSSFLGAIALIIIIEELFVSDDYPFEIIYLSIFFLICYLIIICMYRNQKIYRQFTTYLLIVACIAEAAINSNHEASYKPTGYSYYIEDNASITNILNSVNDKTFYRVEKEDRNTKNDAAWNDYHGVSIFSSTANGYFTELLGKFGFEQSTNAYSYYGNTPLTSSMLSVKYLITKYEHKDPYLMEKVANSDNRYLYELDYVLPLGYMIPEDSLTDFELKGNDPFVIQNNFVTTTTGYENLFTRISATANGKTTTIVPETDCDLYVYVTNYVDSVTYSAYNPDNDFTKSGSATGLNHRRIIHIGEVPANTTVTITTTESDVSSLQAYAYTFDQELFDKVFNELNDEGLVINSYDDTHITGTINAKEDGTMLTSLIYDKSWSVYIDGKKAETGSFLGALLTVNVPAGEHTIEFKYIPDGFILGLCITTTSVILIVLIYAIERNSIKKKKAKKLEEAQTDNQSE